MNRTTKAKTLTLSSMILGYLMIGDYTAYEQNAIGNYFMTLGQILECNAAILQALEEDDKNNVNNPKDINIKNVLENMISKL